LLFPRPDALRALVGALNSDERKTDWAAGNEETVGWVYQYFNAEEKNAAFERVLKKKKKFEKGDLPAATQVFTPRWIVRFLVENRLGRLWLSMHPDSQLGEKLAYLVPLPTASPTVALKQAKEIRILDPATGTMHFGLVAFDLLTEMYREELAQAGIAGWPKQASIRKEADIPGAILANNLFGIDIDLRAVQLAALALYLKAKSTNKQSVLTDSNLACADVAIFRGQHLNKITSEMALSGGFTRELFVKFRDSLEEASTAGQ
jgi:type I restriction-modification system DNA methylase subunit